MKPVFFILFVALLWLGAGFAHAGTGDSNGATFAPAPLSGARARMMQALDARLSAPGRAENSNFLNDLTPASLPRAYKDRKKAFLRSLILPGAGEYYLGKRSLAKTFFFTEVALWLGYFGFRQYSSWVRDDALAFAATHSGANIKNKPSQFFVDIGNYQDVYQYNDAKQRFFQFEKVYQDEDYYWSWDSELNRRKFENMRIASDRAINRSVFVLGAIFANHVLSAVHSMWQANRYNKKLKKVSGLDIQFRVRPDYLNQTVILGIQKRF